MIMMVMINADLNDLDNLRSHLQQNNEEAFLFDNSNEPVV
jgi:hypothetical protein